MAQTRRRAAPAVPCDTPMIGIDLYLHGLPEDCKVMKEHVEKLGGNVVNSYDQSSHIIVSHKTPLVAQWYARHLPDKYQHTVIYFDWVLHVRHKRSLWSRTDYWVIPRPSPCPISTAAFRPFFHFDIGNHTRMTDDVGIVNKVDLNTLLRDYPEYPPPTRPRKIEPLPPIPMAKGGKDDNGIFDQMTIWVQGSPGSREAKENKIRMNGGSTTTAIYQASRIIISRPYSSSSADFKSRLHEAVDRVKENRNSGRMGEREAVAEDWLSHCLELDKLLPIAEYLVPLDDPLNQEFWLRVNEIDPYSLDDEKGVQNAGDLVDDRIVEKHAAIYEDLEAAANERRPNRRYYPARTLHSATDENQGDEHSTQKDLPKFDEFNADSLTTAQNEVVQQLEKNNPLGIDTYLYRGYVQRIIAEKDPVSHPFYGRNERLHAMFRDWKILHPIYDLDQIPSPSLALDAMDITSITLKPEIIQLHMPPTPAQPEETRSEHPTTTSPSIVLITPEKQEFVREERNVQPLATIFTAQDDSGSDWNDSDLEELDSNWEWDEQDASQSSLEINSETKPEIKMIKVDVVEQENAIDTLVFVDRQMDRELSSRNLLTNQSIVPVDQHQDKETILFSRRESSHNDNVDAVAHPSISEIPSDINLPNINISQRLSSTISSSTSSNKNSQKRTLSEVTELGEPLSSDGEMIDPTWPDCMPLPEKLKESKSKRPRTSQELIGTDNKDNKEKKATYKMKVLDVVRPQDEQRFNEMVAILKEQVRLHGNGKGFALFKFLQQTNNLSTKFYRKYRLSIREAVPGLPIQNKKKPSYDRSE